MTVEADIGLAGFVLPAEREAHDPPEARGVPRDGVRLLASRRGCARSASTPSATCPACCFP